jgi:hypothetical protein
MDFGVGRLNCTSADSLNTGTQFNGIQFNCSRQVIVGRLDSAEDRSMQSGGRG